MDDPTILGVESAPGLERAISAYRDAVTRGEAPSLVEWQRRYPDVAKTLEGIFGAEGAIAAGVATVHVAIAAGEIGSTNIVVENHGTLPEAKGLPVPGLCESYAREGGLAQTGVLADSAATLSQGHQNDVAVTTAGQGDETRGFSAAYPSETLPARLGDYELIRPLGQGAMGVVYEARQLSLNRVVAVKMIRSAAFATEAELHRFGNEAEAVAQLDHPRIVPIYSVEKFDGCHFFSMKLIRGGSLAQRLKIFQEDPNAAVAVVIDVARAIQHAHERGILHRDLKPANILLDEEGHPQVTDFGLAKRFGTDSGLTESGAIMGTPSYMAPEQATGRNSLVTTFTDVYGLGAVLYALVTGRPPFLGESVVDTIAQVCERAPVPPARVNPLVRRDLETICLKCLEKEPLRRYVSAAELAEDLRRYLEGEPISARPVSVRERVWKWCVRNRIVAGLMAALTLFAGGSAWQWQRAEWNLQRARYAISNSAVDHALALCEQGDIQRGMLQMARVLSTAPANAAALRPAIRANLSAWSPYMTRLVETMAHKNRVCFVGFGPDGQTALTFDLERTAKLWAITGSGARETVLEHEGSIVAAAFRPDGKLVVTGGMDGSARLWELPSGRPQGKPMRAGAPVRSVAFSPDSSRLVTGTATGTIVEWNIATGQPKGEAIRSLGWVCDLSFGPRGETLLIGGDRGTAHVWDLRTREPIGLPVEFHIEGRGRFSRALKLLAWSPDGTRILSNGAARLGEKTFATLFDPTSNHEVAKLEHDGDIRTVGINRNGTVGITGSEDLTARLWDLGTGKPLGRALRHQGTVLAVALDPDGTVAITGSEDRTARVWSVPGGESLGEPLHHSGQVLAIALQPGGRSILTGCDDHFARLWQRESSKPVGQPASSSGSEGLAHLAYSPDGAKVLIVQSGAAHVRDANTRVIVGHPLRQEYTVVSAAWSPDGSMLLTGAIDGTAQVWSAGTQSPIGEPMMHHGPVQFVAFSRDSQTVLTGSADRTARLWDSATGKPIGPAIDHGSEAVVWVGFDAEENVLTRTESGVVRRWGRVPREMGPDERFILWAHVATGAELGAGGEIHGLEPLVWLEQRKRLESLGGPPVSKETMALNHEPKSH